MSPVLLFLTTISFSDRFMFTLTVSREEGGRRKEEIGGIKEEG
jgi:hypothetical protein